MHPRLLSEKERRRIELYLKADGERTTPMRQLATRSRQYIPRIKADLELIVRFLERYEKDKRASRR